MSSPMASRPVPGIPVFGHALRWMNVNGSCPTCGEPVLWSRDQRDGADGSGWVAPLESAGEAPTLGEDMAMVVVSPTGAVAAVSPFLHRFHRCSKEAVDALLERVGSLGFYDAETLSIACPLNHCGAAPGMLCLNSRREAQYRPHGARKIQAERR